MKRIFIDASLAGRNDGTGRVSYNLTRNILKLDNKENRYILLMYEKDNFPEINQNNLTKIISKYSGKNTIRALWFLFVLPIILFKYKIDLYYSFESFNTPIFFSGKTILTIHDLIPIRMKYYYKKAFNRWWFKFRVFISTRKTKEVIVVSKFTQKEVENVFPIFKNHTHVVYNALDERFIIQNESTLKLPKKFNFLPKKYILSIGGLEERKNNILGIKAYLEILKKDPKFELDYVLVGVGNSAYRNIYNYEIAIPERYRNKFHFLDEVSDSELVSLFFNSYLFLFLSLYEGFGMPLLEAEYYKIPIIATNLTSIPEVVKDSAVLIRNNRNECSNSIYSLINKDKYKELVQKGEANNKEFNWNTSAIKIINNLLH